MFICAKDVVISFIESIAGGLQGLQISTRGTLIAQSCNQGRAGSSNIYPQMKNNQDLHVEESNSKRASVS